MLIALGVTGGIGAYKAVEVARGLQKRGHDVVAIMTRSARRFVGRGHLRGDHAAAGDHRSVRRRARTPTSSTSRSRPTIGLLLVAPATANIIGKFANGIADDFLTSLYLATRAPVLIAPAMNTQHARAPGGAAEPADARGARRAVRRARRGLSRVRLDRQGPPRRARGRSSTAAERVLRPAGAAARAARAS